MVKIKKKRKVNFTNHYQSIQEPANPAKKAILLVILGASLVVITGLICASVFNPEALVKSQISALATDYYENYFYNNLQSSENFQQIKDLNTAMEKYHVSGLSPITLNDLLLYDNQKNQRYRDLLTKYCDENSTTIKFYMDPPYDQKSYHTDITYACIF